MKTTCALVIVLLISMPSVASECPNSRDRQLLFGAESSEVQVDAQRLNDAASIIKNAVADDEIPGAVILVVRRGRVILHEAFGWRNIDRTIQMDRDSLFRMASNSKAVTAAGILLLVEQGRVELDRPVGQYLPAFRNDAWRAITIRHLLTHTSGLRIKQLFLKPLIERPNGPDLRLEVNRFAQIALEVEPGTTYTNDEIADSLVCTTRTVERRLQKIREIWSAVDRSPSDHHDATEL